MEPRAGWMDKTGSEARAQGPVCRGGPLRRGRRPGDDVLAVDRHGNRTHRRATARRVEALFAVSYAVEFVGASGDWPRLRRDAARGTWTADDLTAFVRREKSAGRGRCLIRPARLGSRRPCGTAQEGARGWCRRDDHHEIYLGDRARSTERLRTVLGGPSPGSATRRRQPVAVPNDGRSRPETDLTGRRRQLVRRSARSPVHSGGSGPGRRPPRTAPASR